jgi:hypothetical protein
LFGSTPTSMDHYGSRHPPKKIFVWTVDGIGFTVPYDMDGAKFGECSYGKAK